MKKITAVSLILCTLLFLFTACTSLSTYQDRLKSINKENGTYVFVDFEEGLAEYAEKYELNLDDYNIIESLGAENKKGRAEVIIIVTWSESKAEKLVGDLAPVVEELNANARRGQATFKAMNEGRFVLIGNEPGLADALGK